MPNQYVNKVVQSNGTTLIDISDTTAIASDVASGKYFYLATGEKISGTKSDGGGVTRTNIVPEQTVTGSGYLALTASEMMVAGQNYAYTFDSEERIGTAVAANGTVYLGDVDAFWGNTGGAFATDGYTMYAIANVSGSHTVKIDKITTSSATLITKTITANGTYDADDDSADGYSSVTVNVPSGGASNLVTGTFTGTTTGTAMDIVLPYTGNGYPIAVVIYPSRSGVSTFNSLIQRYVIRDYCADKMNNDAPSYSSSGNVNSGYVCLKYKNSASNSTSYGTGGGSGTVNVYNNTSATASSSLAVQIRSKTKMSVFIASTSYGFAANIEYTYHIVYSE